MKSSVITINKLTLLILFFVFLHNPLWGGDILHVPMS